MRDARGTQQRDPTTTTTTTTTTNEDEALDTGARDATTRL
jgi:hypothetical protein